MAVMTTSFPAPLDGWRGPALWATGLGLAAFVAALISQYGFGWTPCALCLWQRYPYALALPLGGLAVALSASLTPGLRAGLLGLAALAFAAGAAIAVFHTGVEFGWWEGLASCGGQLATDDSLEAFLQRVDRAPVARCDERTPFFAGLSMTNWNLLVSAGLAGLYGLAARRAAAG